MPTARLKLDNPTAGNRTKGTISCWFKRSGLSSNQWIYSERLNSTDYAGVRINSGDTIGIFSYNGGSAEIDANTDAKFRDTNGWYHFVANWDTSLATASDRVKIWINGELQSFSGSPSYPSQSSNTKFGIGSPSGNNYAIVIGRRGDDAEYFDGSMAHYHRVDNQTLAPTVFGETDSTTGIWKPITSPSITYTGSASHNFFLDFADSSDMGNDISGNNNDLTVSGTITQTIDTPSNVFATLNTLCRMPSDTTFSNGNTSIRMLGGEGANSLSTLGASKGKYYWEAKLINWNSTNSRHMIGINTGINSVTGTNERIGRSADPDSIGYSLYLNNVYQNGSEIITGSNMGGSVSANDIYMFALDLDNYKFYIGRNGSWLNSGVPTSGSTGTGSIGTVANDKTYFVATTSNNVDGNNIHNNDWDFNFGNGYFGTTAVASAGTNSGIGTFEYDVPSGYKALCTKNINEQEYS